VSVVATWNPDLPAALLLLAMIFALYIPDVIGGIRTYREGRDLARRITEEHDARRVLGENWDGRS
jgi:hypothetical protein